MQIKDALILNYQAFIMRRLQSEGYQDATEIITEWFMQVCSHLLVKINETKQNQEQNAIRMACDFVESMLHSNALSWQMVSEHVGLSAPYFSQMFKREMGEGLNFPVNTERNDNFVKNLKKV